MCFRFHLAGFLTVTGGVAFVGVGEGLGLLLVVTSEQIQGWEPVRLTLGITKASRPPSMYR